MTTGEGEGENRERRGRAKLKKSRGGRRIEFWEVGVDRAWKSNGGRMGTTVIEQ